MRLCYVAPFESIHTMRWLDYFSKENEVHLISVCRGDPSDYNDAIMFYLNKGINLHLVRSKSNVSPFALLDVIKRIHKLKPDLVHGFYLTNHAFAAALSMYGPFVASAWGSDVLVDPKKNIIFKLCSLFTLHRADLITCDGMEVMKTIRSQCLWEKVIAHIGHGVDTDLFNRVENGERDDVVIYTRGFKEVYDPDTLVDVIGLVAAEKPDVKFLLLGNGGLLDDVKNKIQKEGLAENVEFLGHVDHGKMPEIYAKGKVYLSTSLSDAGMAIGTLEAMACGLPVVVTDSGDHGELLINYGHGFVAPKRNADILAKSILTFLNWPTYRINPIGEGNRMFVELFGNYKKEMGKMDNYYQTLVKGAKQ